MQGTDDTIKALNEAVKTSDHKKIYEFSKELLKDKPNDVEYQQCFALAALRVGKKDELSQGLFKNAPNQEALQQLYAYFLYECGEFTKTVQYINSIKSKESLKLLLAQAHFRAFNYDKSAELMLPFLKEGGLLEQEKEEYAINLTATGFNKVLNHQIAQQYQKMIIGAQRKELLYNYAILMFQCGQISKCLDYLKQFEDSLIKGEDDNDLANVVLLRDYVEWNRSGTVDKGINDTYQTLLKQITNKNAKAVLQNNAICYKPGQNVEHTHEVLRMFEECVESQYKLTSKQRSLIQLNRLTLLLRKGRLPEAHKLIKELESKEDFSLDVDFIKNKYFLLKKTKDPEIENFIKSVSTTNPGLGYALKADLLKERGEELSLLADLKGKGSESSHPVIKTFLFSLLLKHSSLFEQYSDYLAQMAELTSDSNILHILLSIYQNKNDLEKQKFILLRLLKLSPKDLEVKTQLAQLYLNLGNVDQAEETLRGVQGPEELGDIAYLQFIEKNMHISTKKEEQVKEEITHQATHKKRIKKKKRVRLPKKIQKFIEGYKGDPERWLPKWQRKGYKKKGKKGASKTQGLATISKEETKNVFTTGTSTSNKEVTKGHRKNK